MLRCRIVAETEWVIVVVGVVGVLCRTHDCVLSAERHIDPLSHAVVFVYGGNILRRTYLVVFQADGSLSVTASRGESHAFDVLRRTLIYNDFDINVGVFKVGQRDDKPRKSTGADRLIDDEAFNKVIVRRKIAYRNGLIYRKRIFLRQRHHHAFDILVTYVVGRFVDGGRIFVFNFVCQCVDEKVVRFAVNLVPDFCRVGQFILAVQIQFDRICVGRSSVGKCQRVRHICFVAVKLSVGDIEYLSVHILFGNRVTRPLVLRNKLVGNCRKYRRKCAKQHNCHKRKHGYLVCSCSRFHCTLRFLV